MRGEETPEVLVYTVAVSALFPCCPALVCEFAPLSVRGVDMAAPTGHTVGQSTREETQRFLRAAGAAVPVAHFPPTEA